MGYYRTGNSCSKCENDIVCPGGKIDDIVCPSGLHKHDNGQCLDYAPGDCGRVLHIGDAQVYLRSNQITTPSLIVQYADNLFYGNMSTTERGNLRIQIGDIVYSVYDDSML